jgi:hypothetical protein
VLFVVRALHKVGHIANDQVSAKTIITCGISVRWTCTALQEPSVLGRCSDF